MDFLSEDLQHYCETHSSPESQVLKDLNRHTHARVMQPRMLSGHLQGRFLSMVSKMVRPQQILEIGTYTGYSALCLAEGLAEGGRLTTIDVNPELEDSVQHYIEAAGMQHCIRMIIGDAYQIIRTLPQQFDLVFIDADKASYDKYYELVLEKMNPGGIILADNVLWSGKVIDAKALEKDKDTRLLHAFNTKVATDPRVECMLLPLRDGIMMIRKR